MGYLKRRYGNEVAGRGLACFAAVFSLVLFLLCLHLRDVKSGYVYAGLGVVFLLAVLWLFIGIRRAAAVVLSAAFAAVLVFSARVQREYESSLTLDGQWGEFAVEAEGYPTYGSYYSSFDGKVIYGLGKAKVSVVIYKSGVNVAPGDIVTVKGKAALQNDYYFSSSAAEGRYITIRVSGDAFTVSVPESRPIKYSPLVFAETLREIICDWFYDDDAALLSALLTGSKGDMSLELKQNLSLSGTSHVTAVSGMHVGIIAAALAYVLGRKRGMLAALPVMLFFGLSTGLNPPVIRALLMAAIALGAFLFDREGDSVTTVMAAMLLILVIHPNTILSVSFQLSFSAVLGIIILYKPILRTFSAFLPLGFTGNALIRYTLTAISVSVAASAASFPVTSLYFERVSIISPITNLAVLWMVPPIMGLGVLVLATANALPPLASVAAIILEGLLKLFIKAVELFAALPFSSVSGDNYLAKGVIALLVMFLVTGYMIRPKLRKWATMLLIIAIFGMVAFGVHRAGSRLSVTVLDSGAVMIKCGGTSVVIVTDDDINEAGAHDISRALYAWGKIRADALVICDRSLGDSLSHLARQVYTVTTGSTHRFNSLEITASGDENGGGIVVRAGDSSVVCAYGKNSAAFIKSFGILMSNVKLLAVDGEIANNYAASKELMELCNPEVVTVCSGEQLDTELFEKACHALIEYIEKGMSYKNTYTIR